MPETRLKELGYTLHSPAQTLGVYLPVKEYGKNMAFVSGNGPFIGDERITGRVGAECSFEDGRKAAENCTLNILANLKKFLGDLSRVKNCVKMTVFVASADNFYQQPQIANAASELLINVFGDEIGRPARSAVGVNALPNNYAVEIELLIEFE